MMLARRHGVVMLHELSVVLMALGWSLPCCSLRPQLAARLTSAMPTATTSSCEPTCLLRKYPLSMRSTTTASRVWIQTCLGSTRGRLLHERRWVGGCRTEGVELSLALAAPRLTLPFVCIVGVLSLPQTGGRRLQIFTELEEEERRSGGSVVRSPALHLPSGRDDGELGAAEGDDDEGDGYGRGAGGAERMAGGRYESEAAKEALLERLLREYREGKKKSEEEGGMGLRSPDTQDGQPLEHLLLGESLLLTGQDENKVCV